VSSAATTELDFEAQMLAGFEREKKLALLVTEAKTEAARMRLERDLAYAELNKALGEHAPKAWDRIKERLSRV
jgi:hydrogenase maturation factor HypE